MLIIYCHSLYHHYYISLCMILASLLDSADDIALFADMIREIELLIHKVESASKCCGLFLNPSKTKYTHIDQSANDSVHSSDGSQIEKVGDFTYIGSYSHHNMSTRVETL